MDPAIVQGQLINHSYEPIFCWEFYGGITEWNSGCERLYGYSRPEAMGRRSHDLLKTAQSDAVDDISAILWTQGIWSGEVRHRTRDGRELAIESNQQLIEVDHRLLVLEMNRDVTTRRRRVDRTDFLIEAGKVLRRSLDYDGTLKSVVDLAVPALADWAAVDIVAEDGKPMRAAFASAAPANDGTSAGGGDDLAPSGDTVATVIRTATPALMPSVSDDLIVAARLGDGKGLYLARPRGLVSYICAPLVSRGRTLGAITLAAARRYTDHDLQLVQDFADYAAFAVDNAQLFKEAQLANQLKDEFLATLSHELRTPLNAILGFSRMLRLGITIPERQVAALSAVERNATALARMVEDVLDVSRIVAGKTHLNVQSLDVGTIVKSAVETIMPTADAKRIRVETWLDSDTAPISGDADRLQQIVWNLLSNAVKFTPAGGVVQVRVERAGRHIDLVVSDTGIGIDPVFLPHIFERFRQADSATTRERGGLGLGLAIVQHLVQSHGGRIEATSPGIDQGTTFRVRLPVMVGDPPRLERRARVDGGQADAETQVSLEGVRVLAVDDDVDAQRLVREILEDAHAEVATIDASVNALDVISTWRPHVLLSDIGLPVMDGFELIARLRRSPDPAVRGIPAAAVTAHARSEDRVKSLQSGFQMHLSKPVDPVELVAVVASLAGRNRVGDPAPPVQP